MSFWAGVVVGVVGVYAASVGVGIGLGVYLSRRDSREPLSDYGMLIGDEITVEGEYDDTFDPGPLKMDYSEYFHQS